MLRPCGASARASIEPAVVSALLHFLTFLVM
jgi:hypothetical protein